MSQRQQLADLEKILEQYAASHELLFESVKADPQNVGELLPGIVKKTEPFLLLRTTDSSDGYKSAADRWPYVSHIRAPIVTWGVQDEAVIEVFLPPVGAYQDLVELLRQRRFPSQKVLNLNEANSQLAEALMKEFVNRQKNKTPAGEVHDWTGKSINGGESTVARALFLSDEGDNLLKIVMAGAPKTWGNRLSTPGIFTRRPELVFVGVRSGDAADLSDAISEEMTNPGLQNLRTVVVCGLPERDPDPVRIHSILHRQNDDKFVNLLTRRVIDPIQRTKAIPKGSYSNSAPENADAARFAEVASAFIQATKDCGLNFGTNHDSLVRSFLAALATKPFVIFTGLSGSGKTRLAQALGQWLGELKIVAVRPDWTSPDALLGFENALSKPDKLGRRAWNVPETLRFVIRAAEKENKTRPHVLVLDEMNLAHVERYFADFLSGMESGESIIPDLVQDGSDEEFRLRPGSDGLPMPPNLYVIGTVNVDETTYMFSPKVLDRANIFEFRVSSDELTAAKPSDSFPAANAGFVAGFLHAGEAPNSVDETFAGWMVRIHELLSEGGREFGHRTFQESVRFATLLKYSGETDLYEALDRQIAQKVLPRLHGSRRELSELLETLGAFCYHGPDESPPEGFRCEAKPDKDGSGAKLPISYNKLYRMIIKLRDSHYVSFAE